MLEKNIEAWFVQAIKKKGGVAIKLISSYTIGLPDRLVLLPQGKIFFVEFKAPGKKLRLLQIAEKNKLEKLGFEYHVVDSFDVAKKLIHDLLAT